MAWTREIPIRIGHSPDPDDVFMWWPLTGVDGGGPCIDTVPFRFQPVLEDIESLNRRAVRGELEVTALSFAHYPQVRDRYVATACGSSVGDGFGPRLVARRPEAPEAFRDTGAVIAVPGARTTAFTALSLMLGPGRFRWAEVPFDQIIDRVASGEFPAGLVIHEGQLTFADAGLHLVADLGAWWQARTGLPLPLGLNAVRRDLEVIHGPGTLGRLAAILRQSIDHALEHREQSLDRAARFGRGMTRIAADRYVSMYVNHWTQELGEAGRMAAQRLLDEACAAGLCPGPGAFEVLGPAAPDPVGTGG
jgi:1,4-dihydroxy-6-naphthoate synthase